MRPEWFEGLHGIGPALSKEIALAEEMTGLDRVRLIAQHRLEGRNRFEKFALPVVSEADVQPDARDLR